jgi:hypothetical protein
MLLSCKDVQVMFLDPDSAATTKKYCKFIIPYDVKYVQLGSPKNAFQWEYRITT